MGRTAEMTRTTKETDISIALDLDGTGKTDIDTGVPFFDHMLDAFGRHGLFDLTVHAKGDIEVDAHHTVEDCGIVLGTCFARALGEYGATSMLAGNIPGKTATVSQRIAMVIQDGDYVTAGVWTAVVIVIAFVFILVMNLISAKAVKGGRRW